MLRTHNEVMNCNDSVRAVTAFISYLQALINHSIQVHKCMIGDVPGELSAEGKVCLMRLRCLQCAL